MASFRESIHALKEAGLADSEILEIMSESVDGENFIKNSGHELPTSDINIIAETPSIRKRKATALSTEKHPKSIRQDSPGINWEREEVPLSCRLNRTIFPLSVSTNRFSFSADMDEASDLAERALNGEFPELPKKSSPKASKSYNKHAESTKINKKPLFLKNSKFIQNEKQLRDLFYEINPDIKILKSTFYSSGNIKILPKTTNDFLLIKDFAFSSAIYRLTKKHVSIEESTTSFSNSTLCLNKINTTTTLEDIEDAFIYNDIPIKNLKRCTKADGSAMTLVTFSLVNSSDRPELLKNGLTINNQKKAVRDYINRERLIYKCYTCNKIGHLTKNCKQKARMCPKCNNTNCPGTCPKSIWKCINCGGNHSAAYRGCPSIKAAIAKSMDRQQNLSYAQAVCRRTAQEEIDAFKANVIMNVQQLIKIITTVLWEVNKDDFNTIDQLGNKVAQIVKQSVNISTV